MTSFLPRPHFVALALSLLTIGSGAVHAQTDGSADATPADPSETTEIARATPRYLLLGSHGRAVRAEDFRERYQLVAFGFTSCPDVCPTTMLEMQQILASLGARSKRLQPIFITVDPERDTPAVLAAYTRNFDERILGLTGRPELVRWAADNFKVRFEKIQEPGAAPNAYTMDHTAGMYLLGPDGQLLNKLIYGTPVKDIVTIIERWMEAESK